MVAAAKTVSNVAELNPILLERLKSGMRRDGFQDWEPGTPLPEGHYPVGFFYRGARELSLFGVVISHTLFDYHLVRPNWKKASYFRPLTDWSDKWNGAPPGNTDSKGKGITDPRSAVIFNAKGPELGSYRFIQFFSMARRPDGRTAFREDLQRGLKAAA